MSTPQEEEQQSPRPVGVPHQIIDEGEIQQIRRENGESDEEALKIEDDDEEESDEDDDSESEDDDESDEEDESDDETDEDDDPDEL
jgi:hypothetical protein